MENELTNVVESLLSLYTIDEEKVKVLLMRKKTDPYRGYWVLPGSTLATYESLEDNINNVVCEKIGYKPNYIKQCMVFSEPNRYGDERVISCLFMGLIDNVTIKLSKNDNERVELDWFAIDSIPKLGYDHGLILEKSINFLRKELLNTKTIKNLFPSDFTLPELQRVYEQILNKSLDRRNFRKKFVNMGLIEETGEKSEGSNGRPAKYYTFKENVKEKDLF